MLFGHLLTNTAQIFADVHPMEPGGVKRVTGKLSVWLKTESFIY